MNTRVRLSTRFQINVPNSVRTAQGWQAGQELVFIPKGRGVLVIPAPNLEDLRGLARGADPQGYRDREDRLKARMD